MNPKTLSEIKDTPGVYAVKRDYWQKPLLYELRADGLWARLDSGYVCRENKPWADDARFIGPLNFTN